MDSGGGLKNGTDAQDDRRDGRYGDPRGSGGILAEETQSSLADW